MLSPVNDGSEVLEIHLVNDSCTRRYDREIIKRFRCPAEEGVPFPIPLEFPLDIEPESVSETKVVYLDRVINYEVSRNDRVDSLRIATQRLQSVTHRR